VRFLVDMPLSPGLARWLVDQGHDAVHAGDLGLGRASDVVILAQARGEMRTVVTADLDYSRLLALMAAAEPSLILFRGGNWSDREVIDHMQQVLRTVTSAELERSILVVGRGRVRRRQLPIDKSNR
jgi:predicted nuclease of predicted toxin-antitoxin system